MGPPSIRVAGTNTWERVVCLSPWPQKPVCLSPWRTSMQGPFELPRVRGLKKGLLQESQRYKIATTSIIIAFVSHLHSRSFLLQYRTRDAWYTFWIANIHGTEVSQKPSWYLSVYSGHPGKGRKGQSIRKFTACRFVVAVWHKSAFWSSPFHMNPTTSNTSIWDRKILPGVSLHFVLAGTLPERPQ